MAKKPHEQAQNRKESPTKSATSLLAFGGAKFSYDGTKILTLAAEEKWHKRACKGSGSDKPHVAKLCILDVPSGKLTAMFDAISLRDDDATLNLDDNARRLALSTSGSTIAVCGTESIRIWSASSSQLSHVRDIESDGAQNSLRFATDDLLLSAVTKDVSGGGSVSVCQLDSSESEEVDVGRKEGDWLSDFAIDHTGSILATVTVHKDDIHIAFYEVASGKLIKRRPKKGIATFCKKSWANAAVTFTPDNRLVVALEDKKIELYDIEKGVGMGGLNFGGELGVGFSVDSSVFVAVDKANIRCCRADSLEAMQVLDTRKFGISSLSNDHAELCDISTNGQLVLFKTQRALFLWEPNSTDGACREILPWASSERY